MSWLFLQLVNQSPQRHHPHHSQGAESDSETPGSLFPNKDEALASRIYQHIPTFFQARALRRSETGLLGTASHASRTHFSFSPSSIPQQQELKPFGWFSAHLNRMIRPVSSVSLNVRIAPCLCSCSPAAPPSIDGYNKNWYIEILYIALPATIQSPIVSLF